MASFQLSSVAQLCLTLCDPVNRSTPGLPVHHQLPEFTQTQVHRVVMPSSHLILCPPLLLPPSIFPSLRVFSNESVLRTRWPKYWSFSFNISPSSEYSGLSSLLSKGLKPKGLSHLWTKAQTTLVAIYSYDTIFHLEKSSQFSPQPYLVQHLHETQSPGLSYRPCFVSLLLFLSH